MKNIVVDCEFPGRVGHGPVWEMFAPWVRSAVLSRDWTSQTIIETKASLSKLKLSSTDSTVSANSRIQANHKAINEIDIRISELLRKFHLGQFDNLPKNI